jgi:glycosyltransferase involved in cell wall biosynthesis
VLDLVSVCIPCHNAEAYVGQAIESILAQTYPNVEIIVVVDNCTDGSAQVLDRYRSPRVQVIAASLGSAAKSRNLALASAQGHWIKFVDADDLLSAEAIARQLKRLGERSDAVASSAWGRFYGDDLGSFKPNPQSVWRDMNATDWLVEAWRDAQPMTQPGMFLIHRDLLRKTGGWDESLSLIDDFEFYARILCHAKDVLFTPKAILYYRSGIAGSLSQQKTRKAYESAYHSLIKGTGYLLRKRNDAEARKSCANLYQNFIYDAFPRHLDLIKSMESRIEGLGGSDLPMPAGPRLAFLARLIGWRNAKRLRALVPGY